LLHREAQVHHQHFVRDVAHDAQVVRYEEIREAELSLQVGEKVQHLRLHRDVERGDRFVRHDERRAEHECAGDGDPLSLPA
jgi:hypothetical protein